MLSTLLLGAGLVADCCCGLVLCLGPLLELQGLKDSEYPLKEGLQALARARTKGVLKVVFNMEK